jgi:hypothetical protein
MLVEASSVELRHRMRGPQHQPALLDGQGADCQSGVENERIPESSPGFGRDRHEEEEPRSSERCDALETQTHRARLAAVLDDACALLAGNDDPPERPQPLLHLRPRHEKRIGRSKKMVQSGEVTRGST